MQTRSCSSKRPSWFISSSKPRSARTSSPSASRNWHKFIAGIFGRWRGICATFSFVPCRTDEAIMSAEQDIRDAEARLYKAMIANDAAGLDAITSAELAYVHSTAVVESKAEWLAGV